MSGTSSSLGAINCAPRPSSRRGAYRETAALTASTIRPNCAPRCETSAVRCDRLGAEQIGMLALGYFDLCTPRLSIRNMQASAVRYQRLRTRLDWLSHSPGQGLNPCDWRDYFAHNYYYGLACHRTRRAVAERKSGMGTCGPKPALPSP